MFLLTQNHRRNISKIIPYGVTALLFGTIYAFIEKGLIGSLHYYPATGNPYNFYTNTISTITQSLIMGLLLGTVEVILLDRIFSKSSFLIKFISKSVIYITTILICVAGFSLISSSLLLNVSLFSPTSTDILKAFFSDTGFWSIMLYVGAVFSFAICMSELSDHLGQPGMYNFLKGKYHKPKEEERIFMFLDMKSSTTLAEHLGHIRYFKLLNEYYADITRAIIETKGEIYQYVGDEVVVSWDLKDGLENNNCIRCFFRCKKVIMDHEKKYLKDFHLIPEFKAGLHSGHVTTGRIGLVKKEIIFTGDVLNTAARIQSDCNHNEVDILISGELLDQLSPGNEYITREIGETKFRGKDQKVKLYTLAPG